MKLFDPRPKSHLNEFFDREEELNEFIRSVNTSPLTLVLGLRRYGKTSLILTGLNSIKAKYLYIDCRMLPSGMIGVSDFTQLLAMALNRFTRRYRSLRSALFRLLEGVSGVHVGAFGIAVNLRRFQPSNLMELFESLNELDERVILVIDEAQELRRMARYRADQLLAYIYDNFRNLRLVLSGSQIGLLHRLLRLDDSTAPLYGRAYAEIRLRRLSNELSREFLKKGFEEQGLSPPEDFMDYVVDSVDGVIGWLTYIGFKVSILKSFSREAVDEVLEEAFKIVLEELENFLSLRPMARRRYVEALRAIALLDEASWSNIYG